MSLYASITILSGLIVALVALRTVLVIRSEKDAPRGSPPGIGDHIVEAPYHSGGAGGGHDGRFTVPRDPQEYAKRFVPKQKDRT